MTHFALWILTKHKTPRAFLWRSVFFSGSSGKFRYLYKILDLFRPKTYLRNELHNLSVPGKSRNWQRLHMSRSSLRGSSTISLIRRKKNTASLPSISRWSYVSAIYIIGLGTTLPPTTIGRFTIECMPNIADCPRKIDNEIIVWKNW